MSQPLLASAVKRLEAAGVPGAARDVRLLWAHAGQNEAKFDELIARREKREPVSHLIGRRAFYEHEFEVTRDVLDPRPETELLVLEALAHPFERVLDLGTGSGCILLSLLAARDAATGVGVDASEQALIVARRNANALQLQQRCHLFQSDWFTNVTGRFDLIVSNPPYITAEEMDELSPEVRQFEPHFALTDGADGLTAYRAILERAREFLKPGGRLLFEIGASQGARVRELMEKAGFAEVNVLIDLDSRDRVVAAVLPE